MPVATPRPGLAGLVNRLDCMVFRFRNDLALTVEYASAGTLALTGYTPAQLGVAGGTSYQALLLDEPMDRMAIAAGRRRRPRPGATGSTTGCSAPMARSAASRSAAGWCATTPVTVTHFEGFAEDITEQRSSARRRFAKRWSMR